MNRNALLAIGLWAGVWCFSSPPSQALINPNYTVVDLVRESRQILLLRISAPEARQLKAEVVEALLGEMPEERKLVFDVRDAAELSEDRVTGAFAGARSALAVMAVWKEKDDVQAALEIGVTWLGLVQGADISNWQLDRDPKDLETVWGGSVRQLIPAIRYALTDPRPDFPVASELTWNADLLLGKLDGPARGCLVTELGTIVWSEGGDRVYASGADGAPPTDVTDKLGVSTRSHAMTAGDFNGDGQWDLASWDGTRLHVLPQSAGGVFGPALLDCELTHACNLESLGSGFVAGVRDGLILLHPDSSGGIAKRRLEIPGATLGPGGVCAVADFNDDGVPDIVQVFARALVLHAGRPDPGAFAAPIVTEVATVKHPTAVVCGDYDTDGHLDLMVGGIGGSALLLRGPTGAWRNAIAETGELGAASGLGQGDDLVVTACASDLNADGRQAAAFFHATSGPGLFFNRGFAAFGIARSLDLAEVRLPAAEALGAGQTTGVLSDLNGDLAPDLLAVDPQHNVRVLLGARERPRRFQVAVSLANPASGPLTVTAVMGDRPLGTWVIRPGVPSVIHLPRAGPLKLQWKTPDGTAASRPLVVTRPTSVAL